VGVVIFGKIDIGELLVIEAVRAGGDESRKLFRSRDGERIGFGAIAQVSGDCGGFGSGAFRHGGEVAGVGAEGLGDQAGVDGAVEGGGKGELGGIAGGFGGGDMEAGGGGESDGRRYLVGGELEGLSGGGFARPAGEGEHLVDHEDAGGGDAGDCVDLAGGGAGEFG